MRIYLEIRIMSTTLDILCSTLSWFGSQDIGSSLLEYLVVARQVYCSERLFNVARIKIKGWFCGTGPSRKAVFRVKVVNHCCPNWCVLHKFRDFLI